MSKTWKTVVVLCFLGGIVAFVVASGSSMLRDPPDYVIFLKILCIIFFLSSLGIIWGHIVKRIADDKSLSRPFKIISATLTIASLAAIVVLILQIFFPS